MIYYAFNKNKPLAKGKNNHIFLIHYCPNCNTEIIGEWLEVEYKKSETYQKHQKKEDSQAKKIFKFAELKVCPLCGGDFDDNLEHHFSNSYYYSEKGDIKNFYYVPTYETSINYNTLITDSAHTLQKGEKVITQKGSAVVTANFPESAQMHVHYYEKMI